MPAFGLATGMIIHFVVGSRVVMARSSSSSAPGVFRSFLTRARIAFSHILLCWCCESAADSWVEFLIRRDDEGGE